MKTSRPWLMAWAGLALALAVAAALAGAWDHAVVFSLGPTDYVRSVNMFVTGARDVDVDTRMPGAELPYVLPGPADRWAGRSAHTLRLHLSHRPPEPLVLELFAAETHDVHPPRLSVAVNDRFLATVETHRGTGLPPPHRTRGVRARYAVPIPASPIGAAPPATLSITNAVGSWIMWERIRVVKADRDFAWAYLVRSGPLPWLSAVLLAGSALAILTACAGTRPQTPTRPPARLIGLLLLPLLLGLAHGVAPNAPLLGALPRWLWIATAWALLASASGSLRRAGRLLMGADPPSARAPRDIPRASVAARLRAATTLLALIALLSAGRAFVDDARRYAATGSRPTLVTASETRFRSVRRALPARGVVGYLSDAGIREFYLAQYALVPVIVIASPEPDLVVGNFYGAGDPESIVARRDLVLVEDFGDGVMLFRRRDHR